MTVTRSFNGTYTRHCDSLRQPCPNPHQCSIDCHFNTADLPAPKCCTGDCDQGRSCPARKVASDIEYVNRMTKIIDAVAGASFAFAIVWLALGAAYVWWVVL